jgi:hypothetical protein
MPFIGVLVIDLKFDFHPNSEYTKNYYVGHFNNIFPYSRAVDLLMFFLIAAIVKDIRRNLNFF